MTIHMTPDIFMNIPIFMIIDLGEIIMAIFR